MAKFCQINRKKSNGGNSVSHSMQKRTKIHVNLFKENCIGSKRSAGLILMYQRSLRIINKVGLYAALKKAASKGYLNALNYRSTLIMGKKAKGDRIQVILECTEHKESGMPGTSRYITTKNRKNTTQRVELKKYNPVLKKMTLHKEIK